MLGLKGFHSFLNLMLAKVVFIKTYSRLNYYGLYTVYTVQKGTTILKIFEPFPAHLQSKFTKKLFFVHFFKTFSTDSKSA
jgi:hypothetical protein